jgi:hypothetical protein
MKEAEIVGGTQPRGRGSGIGRRRRKPPYLKGEEFKTTLKDIKWNWPDLFSAFLLLSNNRLVWLGRTGYGATRALRWRCLRDGTGYIIENVKDKCTPLQTAILENLMMEGTIFASYDSLLEYLGREGYQPETQEDEKLISDIRYWVYRREEK